MQKLTFDLIISKMLGNAACNMIHLLNNYNKYRYFRTKQYNIVLMSHCTY